MKEPTTQDIIDHLKEQQGDGEGFSSQEELDAAVRRETQPFDISQLTEDERAALEGRNEATEVEEEKPNSPLAPEFSVPSTSDSIDFQMDFSELGNIEVSDIEKDLYIKSLLNDTPFEVEISLFPGFKVTIRSRSVFYDDLVYDLVKEAHNSGDIMGVESGFTKIMRLLAGCQVTRVQGKDVTFSPTSSSRKEIGIQLNQHATTTYDNFSMAKWNAVVKAVRVFDAKQKICNDRILDRTFWEGADTN